MAPGFNWATRLLFLGVLALASATQAGADRAKKSPLRLNLENVERALLSSRNFELVMPDDATLAFRYYTPVPGAKGRPPFALHLVTFEIIGRNVVRKATLDLGVQKSATAQLFPTADNRLLLVNDGEATRFDAQLHPLARRSLADDPSAYSLRLDRKTVMLTPIVGRASPRRLMDTSTLEEVSSPVSLEGANAVSFDYAVRTGLVDEDVRIAVRKRWGEFRPVAIPVARKGLCLSVPGFVAEHLFVISDCRGRLFWIDAETLAWSETSLGQDHRSLLSVRPSRDGSRFAALRHRWRWMWVPLEGSGRVGVPDGVDVFDVPSRTLIFSKSFDNSLWRLHNYPGTFALSDSGSRLAFYDNGVLEVYDLPWQSGTLQHESGVGGDR